VVKEMLIVKTNWRAGTPLMANPAGHWNPPPVAVVPRSQIVVLHEARLTNGVWQAAKLSPEVPPPSLVQTRRNLRPVAGRQVRIVRPTVKTEANTIQKDGK
jgi:hypothetical protein